MKKRFGIDIDGTITRPDTMIPFLNKAFQLNLVYEDITEYDLNPFVTITKDAFADWFARNEPIIYAESLLADGAKEAIAEWVDKADLYFISARHHDLLKVTEKWFHKNELTFHHIELTGSHDKVETAKKFGVDIFFEDKHDNAVAIASECNIPVILFDTPYNRLSVPAQVIRVTNWQQAKQWVDQWLKNEKK
ncbi:hypothetical protein ELQ35_12640 [Peribacillus cavernae]|uniref:Nucleotidase n=1 Tax=Peribacillus cavernae TaxID=1674310 RepID=A0A433HJP4_9BACI|nr:hypothetical protein [Peribacillus cavernae]MDQ0218291.1 putative HAD superfamily protein [Peribacillus cavernae]RUQ28425.1 hypothetical protein ELQ35_12640 [Peribacillus cavernae]